MSRLKELLETGICFYVNKKLIAAVGVDVAYFVAVLQYVEEQRKHTGAITEDGFFPLTIDEMEWLGIISRRKQDRLIKLLMQYELIEMKLKGCPQVRHFKINQAKFLEYVGQEV